MPRDEGHRPLEPRTPREPACRAATFPFRAALLAVSSERHWQTFVLQLVVPPCAEQAETCCGVQQYRKPAGSGAGAGGAGARRHRLIRAARRAFSGRVADVVASRTSGPRRSTSRRDPTCSGNTWGSVEQGLLRRAEAGSGREVAASGGRSRESGSSRKAWRGRSSSGSLSSPPSPRVGCEDRILEQVD